MKIWIDGPISQFKNQYVIASMNMLSKKHNVSPTWNFSATSHSKGPVDGCGNNSEKINYGKGSNMQSSCKQYWWVLPSSPRLQHYGNIDEYYWIAKIFKWAVGNTVQQFNSHSQDSRKYSSQVPHVPEHDPEIVGVNVKEPDYNTSPTVLEVGHW